MKKIGFLGAGNMAFAMAGAVLAGKDGAEVMVYDISPERVLRIQESFSGIEAAASPAELVKNCDMVVLAVKPQVMPAVLGELKALPEGYGGPDGGPLYLSIAAGLPLSFFYHALPGARIVRVMPNTPALVGEAASGYTLGEGVSAEDERLVKLLLEASGEAEEVEESLMDAVTGLSGSGPAFFARVAEAFIEAGVELGLSPRVSRTLVLQTMKGTASLLKERDLEPEELIRMVSSPNGTTVAGREVLESSHMKEILGATVKRAAERSKELGR